MTHTLKAMSRTIKSEASRLKSWGHCVPMCSTLEREHSISC